MSFLNKVVYSRDLGRYVIFRKTLAEIRDKNISFEGQRPLVLFEDIYEALEKALYLYEKGFLPLIGDTSNPDVLFSSAKKYGVDCLISDEMSWHKFQREFQEFSLKSVAVLKS